MTEFILFFDPESESFYSYSQNKGLIVKEYPPQFIQAIIREQQRQYRKLIQKKQWTTLNDFQNRPIPRFYITERKYKYPVYITQQSMPQALLENKVVKNALIMNGIRLKNMSSKGDETPTSTKIGHSKPKQSSKIKQQYIDKISVKIHLLYVLPQLRNSNPKADLPSFIEFNAKLLISANEVIRIVCRRLLEDYETQIKTKRQNKLILKLVYRNEYIYGNEPFLKFETVREAIKNQRVLDVQILQTDITDRAQFRRFLFERDESDMNKGIFTPFPWETLLYMKDFSKMVTIKESFFTWDSQDKYSFLMWYRPNLYCIDPREQSDQFHSDVISEEHKVESPMEKAKRQQQKNIQMETMKIELQEKVPRYIWKQRIFNFLEERRDYIRDKLVDLQGSTTYTGQFPIVFSFKVAGLTGFDIFFKKDNQTIRQIYHRQKSFLKFTKKEESEDKNYPRKLISPFSRNRRFADIRKNGEFPIVPYQISVMAEFYYNGDRLGAKEHTYETRPVIAGNNFIKINETFEWILLSKIMLEVNIVFTVKVFSKEGAWVIGGMGVLKVFDEYGYLRQGVQQIKILPVQKINTNKLGCMDKNFEIKEQVANLYVEMPTFKQQVRWSLEDVESLKLLGYAVEEQKEQEQLNHDYLRKVTDILNKNPIEMLEYSAEEKKILHRTRNFYKHQSSKLQNYLLAVDWTNTSQIHKAYQTLQVWSAPTPIEALLLMNRHISDEKVRLFAMQNFERIEEFNLVLYANQVTQALVSFETHQNPLIDFIIEKSCENPYQIGQEYFWQFRNRINDPIIGYRFTMYLETLVFTCPVRCNFYKQVMTNTRLITFNKDMVIKVGKNSRYEDRRKYFKNQISQLQSYLKGGSLTVKPRLNTLIDSLYNDRICEKNFIFPIRPQCYYDTIEPKHSNVFDSKKMPFSLACLNLHTHFDLVMPPYRVMFKEGDDIKQDHLILQLLRIFDGLWLKAGYDFQMNIYRVLSTGDEVGFIEVVEDAVNVSKIHNQSDGLIGAFYEKATYNFLREQNLNEEKHLRLQQFNLVRQNFRKSCAGYLVATYVLGIADRHSGNIMLQKRTGRIFHIDFGHILGNFKHKAGFKRERTPFIFTSEHAHVMDGPESHLFEKFEKDCSVAYNVLRRNGSMIIQLLMTMVAADIPELQSYNDIGYVVEKLALDLSQSQASERIVREIRQTLQSEQAQNFNNVIHEWHKVG